MSARGRARGRGPTAELPGEARLARQRAADEMARAVRLLRAAFPGTEEEADYVDPVGLNSAAHTRRDREAVRRSIENLGGMAVLRAQEVEHGE